MPAKWSRTQWVELAGKREDVEYIRQNHSELLHMYQEVCESMAGL